MGNFIILFQIEKLAFYCCVWANISSVHNAIKSGLRPEWVELTVIGNQRIKLMNQ